MTRPELARRARLDADLVRRGLARNRLEAAALISAGRVKVAGTVATKAATGVTADTPVLIDEPAGPQYVSRGAHKLLGALDAFDYHPGGQRVLDAGASTGGFTEVLLARGAAHVVAADVGYGQLAWSLQTDERVTVLDRTNVRSLTPEQIGGPVDLVVADLSFISLGVVLPALLSCTQPAGDLIVPAGDLIVPAGDLIVMVKPQFEVGRARLPSGGVVRAPDLRAQAVRHVARQAAALGLGCRGVCASPLPGTGGNVEYFLWLRKDAPLLQESALQHAVAAGPA